MKLLVVFAAALAALALAVQGHGDCGLDLPELRRFRLNNGSTHQRRDSSEYADARYQLPEATTDGAATPECTRNGAASPLGYGYSECFIPIVSNAYVSVSDRANLNLKLQVLALRSVSETYVSSSQVDEAVGNLNSLFAEADIQFDHDTSIEISTSRFNSLDQANNGAGVNSRQLDYVINYFYDVFNMGSTASARDYHTYILVTKLDVDSIRGVCYPDIAMMEEMPDSSGNAQSLLGNLCIVDYRYFLSSSQGGASDSTGATTAHEVGHSLGLLHTHQGVNFESNLLNYCASGGEEPSCYASAYEGNSYYFSDFLADTAAVPNLNAVRNGTSGSPANSFNTASCTTGSSFPTDCNGNEFPDSDRSVKNIMSYTVNSCRTRFSSEQIGRMHCFVDRYADNSRRAEPQSQRPLMVTVPTFYNQSCVQVQWLPPLDFLRANSRGSSLVAPSSVQYVLTRTPGFSGGDKVFSSNVYRFLDNDLGGASPYDFSYRVFARENSVDGVKTGFVAVREESSGFTATASALALALMALVAVFI